MQRESSLQAPEPRPSPKERYHKIQSDVLEEINKYRDKCSSWEDVADVRVVLFYLKKCLLIIQHAYQSNVYGTSSRVFTKFSPVDHKTPATFSFRLRVGRLKRLVVDRCLVQAEAEQRGRSHDEQAGSELEAKRVRERWRYDDDETNSWEAGGIDELEKFVVDDFDARSVLSFS